MLNNSFTMKVCPCLVKFHLIGALVLSFSYINIWWKCHIYEKNISKEKLSFKWISISKC